jgi:AcrR family transcriptional regulator
MNEDAPNAFARDYLYQALVQLMGRKTYSKITVTDIAARAGVSRTSFYQYYKDKDDILREHIDRSFQVFLTSLQTIDNQHDFWRAFVRQNLSDEIIRLMARAGRANLLFRCARDYAPSLIERYFHWNLEQHVGELALQYHTAGVAAIVAKALAQPGRYSDDELIQVLESSFEGIEFSAGQNLSR